MAGTLSVSAQTNSCSFTRDLTVGSRGSDVNCLQEYLKTQGFFPTDVSTTNYFGPTTQTAVRSWQLSERITPAQGYFGSVSRQAYNQATGQTVSNPTQDTTFVAIDSVRSALEEQIRSLMKQLISLLQQRLAQTLDQAGIDRSNFSSALKDNVATRASNNRSTAADNRSDNSGGGSSDTSEDSSLNDEDNNSGGGGGASSPSNEVDSTDDDNDSEDSQAGDEAALEALYSSTNGSDWDNNSGWSSSGMDLSDDIYGVETDTIGGELRVTEIDLFQNNLVGTIDQIPWGNLKEVTYLRLKQPARTHAEIDNQEERLTGELPASIGEMTKLTLLSLSGQDKPMTTLRKDYNAMSRNHHFLGGGKKVIVLNKFTGTLPSEWGNLSNLEVLELRHSHGGIIGEVPDSWSAGMESLIILYIDDNGLTGPLPDLRAATNIQNIGLGQQFWNGDESGFTGPIPDTYGNFEHLVLLSLSNNLLSGETPIFNQRDIRSFNIGTNPHGWVTDKDDHGRLSRLPAEIFTDDGRNPYLDAVYFSYIDFVDTLQNYDVDGNNYPYIDVLDISRLDSKDNNIPSWAATFSPVQNRFYSAGYTGFGSEWYNPDANIYTRPRYLYLWDNELGGELPDVPFAPVLFKTTLSGTPISDTEIPVNLDMGVLYTETVGTASSEWIQVEAGRSASWITPDWQEDDRRLLYHEVRLIDPDGAEPDITFEIQEGGNSHVGTLYSRTQADLTGTEGWRVEIRPYIENRLLRIKIGENRWIPRRVVSHTQTNIILDDPISSSLNGYTITGDEDVWIHGASRFRFGFMANDNNFVGQIPESWGRIPTYRSPSNEFQIHLRNSNLEGTIPSFEKFAEFEGSTLGEVHVQGNKFLFRDILEHYAANTEAIDDFRYAPQKPFGVADSYSYSEGANITLDDFNSVVTHTDNQYQWKKDGSDISGATNREYTINNADTGDAGTYTLEVTNPGVPNLTLESEEIDITVGGVQGVQTNRSFLQQQLDAARDQLEKLLELLKQ